jgi:hypothetical protein
MAQHRTVRYRGIMIAVALRVVLLFVMIRLIDALSEPFFVFKAPGWIEGCVNFATIVFVLAAFSSSIRPLKRLVTC